MKGALPVFIAGTAVVGLLLYAPIFIYCHRHIRLAAIKDCRTAQTQEVNVPYPPSSLHWKIAGRVEGRGTVILPTLYTNTVSGAFSAEGGSDYYDSSAWLIYLPQGATGGWIEASFRFTGGP